MQFPEVCREDGSVWIVCENWVIAADGYAVGDGEGRPDFWLADIEIYSRSERKWTKFDTEKLGNFDMGNDAPRLLDTLQAIALRHYYELEAKRLVSTYGKYDPETSQDHPTS